MEMSAPMKDKNYNLISVLYHTLQGCETCSIYLEDAEKSGDKELADFFREVDGQYRQIVDRAKGLLSPRLK
jgi:hypothetical protein